ncbi:hypothetical protein LCGC14_2677740, partial [marine sediment metagenome]
VNNFIWIYIKRLIVNMDITYILHQQVL